MASSREILRSIQRSNLAKAVLREKGKMVNVQIETIYRFLRIFEFKETSDLLVRCIHETSFIILERLFLLFIVVKHSLVPP